MVRIPGSHPGGPGSIPGCGIFFIIFYNYFFTIKKHIINHNIEFSWVGWENIREKVEVDLEVRISSIDIIEIEVHHNNHQVVQVHQTLLNPNIKFKKLRFYALILVQAHKQSKLSFKQALKQGQVCLMKFILRIKIYMLNIHQFRSHHVSLNI